MVVGLPRFRMTLSSRLCYLFPPLLMLQIQITRHSGPFFGCLASLEHNHVPSKLTFNVLKQLKTSVVDRSTFQVGIITCSLSLRSCKPLRHHCAKVVLLIPCFNDVPVNIHNWKDQHKINFIT
ncbi:hypothetical protein CMV_006897 [Castanea mollissima]|uniref:Uncharacterized protein n=1 Tax=Castanea mollissima TaxID=60419 RepID=A0A8J4RJ17_9ROSI|nr:hypothetical protein CMV_006897 [Castanea mollissima]